MRWQVLLVSLGLLGCTKSNPAKSCSDGTCTDPAYPFCDVSGAIAGEAGACIATSCTADTFVECRGDVEVRCNVDGSNYNLRQCERGCDDTLGGCRLCNPGETACTNGVVASCDATGVPTVVESCPLGCFGSEPRCTEIDPSNDLAMYFDMVADPPSVTLENGVIHADTDEVYDNQNGTLAPVTVPSFAVAAPPGGVPLRVLVVESLTITQAGTASSTSPAPALVILARGEIRITGRLAANKAGAPTNLVACSASSGGAGPGLGPNNCTTKCGCSTSSSGGGAFATNGAKGGNLNSFVGGSGGIANGNAALVPLRGGCSAGAPHGGGAAALGGGAVQLVSRHRIVIDGIIDVRGTAGYPSGWSPVGTEVRALAMTSGGAGGGVLLEAPVVELGPNAVIDASGGAGGSTCPSTAICATSGTGAAPNVAATPGMDVSVSCAAANANTSYTAGGGGGGLGRVRINTADGTYVKSSSATELGDLAVGTLETR